MRAIHRENDWTSHLALTEGRARRNLARALGIAVIVLVATIFAAPIQAQVVTGRLLDAQSDLAVVLRYVALLTEEGEMVAWTLTDDN